MEQTIGVRALGKKNIFIPPPKKSNDLSLIPLNMTMKSDKPAKDILNPIKDVKPLTWLKYLKCKTASGRY